MAILKLNTFLYTSRHRQCLLVCLFMTSRSKKFRLLGSTVPWQKIYFDFPKKVYILTSSMSCIILLNCYLRGLSKKYPTLIFPAQSGGFKTTPQYKVEGGTLMLSCLNFFNIYVKCFYLLIFGNS